MSILYTRFIILSIVVILGSWKIPWYRIESLLQIQDITKVCVNAMSPLTYSLHPLFSAKNYCRYLAIYPDKIIGLGSALGESYDRRTSLNQSLTGPCHTMSTMHTYVSTQRNCNDGIGTITHVESWSFDIRTCYWFSANFDREHCPSGVEKRCRSVNLFALT